MRYVTSNFIIYNQFFKWKSVRKWHKKEKQKYEESLQYKDAAVNSRASNNPSLVPGELSDVDVGCTGPRGELLRNSAPSLADSEVLDPGMLPTNIYE